MYKNFGLAKSKCSHEGCSKKLKGEELSKHEIICKYQRISCPLFAFKKCPEEIRMKDMKDHLLTKHVNHPNQIHWQRLTLKWLHNGSKGSKKTKQDKSCAGALKSFSPYQHVFLFIENGSLKKDGLFKVYAFLVDPSPKKALHLRAQVEAKKTQTNKMGIKRSGPVNGIIGEQNPVPCFTMTLDESLAYQQGEETIIEFQLMAQRSPKISIWDFAYQNCRKIIKGMK